MRAAPMAFVLDPSRADDRRTIRDVSRITHHNEEAYVGALAVVVAIRGTMTGQASPEHLLEYVREFLPDSATRDRVDALAPLSISVAEAGRRFGTSGHVVDAVPLAIYAAQNLAHESAIDAVSSAVSAGGDTDTIASIAGQIIGTRMGPDSLPSEVLQSIVEIGQIYGQVEQFSAAL